MKESIIEKKSLEFAVSVVELYKDLINSKEFVLSKQLLRSGTSIGANVQEAYFAQSKKDFISKMHIDAKEARETKYWLVVIGKSKFVNIDLKSYLDSVEEILKILSAIIKTSKNRLE